MILSGASSEDLKSLRHLSACLEKAIEGGATRRSVIVGFGGGVPGNLAGVIAGLLFRGVRLVHVPTTLLAATDSVISLKQAINSDYGKNHFGVYLRPEAIVCDVLALSTLPVEHVTSGLCEVAKNCLALEPDRIPELLERLTSSDRRDPEFFSWILRISMEAKVAITRDDPFERRAGLALEYGHTVGHGIESCAREVGGSVSHGEAVAVGLRVAAQVSVLSGNLSPTRARLHGRVWTSLGPDLRCLLACRLTV